MAIVTIIGAGLMGTATAYPLSDNGHDVRLVGTHLDGEIIAECKKNHYHMRLKRSLPPGVKPYYVEELTSALSGADIIVSGVNSNGVHWMGQTLGPLIGPQQTIIAITKGLECDDEGNLRILPDVLRDALPQELRANYHHAAVGGPCIAGELAGKRASLVLFGSRDLTTAERLAAIFRTPYYHIWPTADLESLEFCAALKNAYTLGVGLAYGRLEKSGGVDASGAHMFNLAAGLFGVAATEIGKILDVMGLDRAFAYGLPGVGDMYVTCVGGRTIRLGTLLGSGRTYPEAREIMAGETLESVEIIRVMGQALPALEARGELGENDLLLLRTLIEIVVHGQAVESALDKFFGEARPLT